MGISIKQGYKKAPTTGAFLYLSMSNNYLLVVTFPLTPSPTEQLYSAKPFV